MPDDGRAPLRATLHGTPVSEEAAPHASSTAHNARGGFPVAPRYYTAQELDIKPGIMTRVDPAYPEPAAKRSLAGKVVIRLLIDELGMVERAFALRAEPAGYFEESAERAFALARFTPGVKNGQAVRVQLTFEVNFESPPPLKERYRRLIP